MNNLNDECPRRLASSEVPGCVVRNGQRTVLCFMYVKKCTRSPVFPYLSNLSVSVVTFKPISVAYHTMVDKGCLRDSLFISLGLVVSRVPRSNIQPKTPLEGVLLLFYFIGHLSQNSGYSPNEHNLCEDIETRACFGWRFVKAATTKPTGLGDGCY